MNGQHGSWGTSSPSLAGEMQHRARVNVGSRLGGLMGAHGRHPGGREGANTPTLSSDQVSPAKGVLDDYPGPLRAPSPRSGIRHVAVVVSRTLGSLKAPGTP
jgi:hypothetical protein